MVANRVDEERVMITRKGFRPAVDRHGAHFRSPVLRWDFFARGITGGDTAPAISILSIMVSCFKKASTGCIDGKADLVPWIAISMHCASSSTVTPLASFKFRARQTRLIVAATSSPKRAE